MRSRSKPGINKKYFHAKKHYDKRDSHSIKRKIHTIDAHKPTTTRTDLIHWQRKRKHQHK